MAAEVTCESSAMRLQQRATLSAVLRHSQHGGVLWPQPVQRMACKNALNSKNSVLRLVSDGHLSHLPNRKKGISVIAAQTRDLEGVVS